MINDESKYRLLVEAVTDCAIYLLTPSGHISSWNVGAQRLMGYTSAEILGEHFSRFYTPEDLATGLPARALATAAREGRFEGEGWRVRKDGTRFWAKVVIDPVRDEQGELIGFAKITRDLTEQRIADEALRRSAEQFRLLVQGVNDYAICLLDTEGYVASWNAGAARIKGYTQEEILGQPLTRFYTDEDVQAGYPARNLDIALRTGVYEGEGWRVRKDGTRFWAHVVIDRLTDDSGKVIGFAKITRDVTDKRRAESDLAAAREALLQSQKTEAIGQLTGGVAHDFNNLLMAVMGNLELLKKWLPPDPRPHVLLDNALAGAQRGATLTQRMLAFARRQDLHPQAVDIPALVTGMADLLKRSLGPQVSVDTRFELPLPRVMIDGNQLELALLNLAVNGRDAMPEGGRLRIGARREHVDLKHPTQLASGDYVHLWVADEGTGMDPATVKRATEPFFTTKGVGKGTGLGLSMAQGLAEQSGGRLMIQTAPGAGTTVEIWLPVASEAALRKAALPVAPEPPAPATHATLTVLLVDDDELVLMSTAAIFEDLGHRVLEARSGDEALRLLERSGEIELLVTDHAMPGMTGARLCQIVRETHADLPIILASGYADLPGGPVPDVVRLTKPFSPRSLERAIDEAMARRSSGTLVTSATDAR